MMLCPGWGRAMKIAGHLTSLQGPLGHFGTEHSQAGFIKRGHLDLVIGPDNEVLQEQAAEIRVGQVSILVIHRQAGQAVSGQKDTIKGTSGTF